MGRGYIQTRRYRTTRDRWRGNNSKAIRHMRNNMGEHKRTKENQIKGTDERVKWRAGMRLESVIVAPEEQQ